MSQDEEQLLAQTVHIESMLISEKFLTVLDSRKCKNEYNKQHCSHPSSFKQLPTKLLRWVVEGELLTAEVIDRRVAFQVEKEVIIEANFLWFFLKDSVDAGRGEQSGPGQRLCES